MAMVPKSRARKRALHKSADAPGRSNERPPRERVFQYLNSGMAFNSSLVALYTA
jgi:hypothetical protein